MNLNGSVKLVNIGDAKDDIKLYQEQSFYNEHKVFSIRIIRAKMQRPFTTMNIKFAVYQMQEPNMKFWWT